MDNDRTPDPPGQAPAPLSDAPKNVARGINSSISPTARVDRQVGHNLSGKASGWSTAKGTLHQIADAIFRRGKGGRRKGQKTALRPEQAAEITAYVKQRRAINDTWPNIVAELKRRYPEEVYDRTWNERTLRRWINE